MKMAKASEADMDMASDLFIALDSIMRYGMLPEGERRLDLDDGDDARAALRELLRIASRGSLGRVVMGMATVLDPRNEVVDPDSDVHRPETRANPRSCLKSGRNCPKCADASADRKQKLEINMTDRELLEAAAKAAGLGLGQWDETNRSIYYPFRAQTLTDGHYWDPLTDDGDALRLAVKLGLAVSVELQVGSTAVLWGPPTGTVREQHESDPCAATRRAIVRAAASLWRG